ncbi:uncharacterized protein PAC_13471 [Phialocephala subalpina]|uniref:Uncharacterized protein n=1 Tax=Phialocephala subalpina TaxID=576137 RepID=A0A1L7XEX5_9HELO|nr:uncharacterized protein PAC_13471 [Phialocephala subalpina]
MILGDLISRLCVVDVAQEEESLMERCKLLDDDFVTWATRFGPKMSYITTEATSPRLEAFGTEYHLYRNIASAHSWNIYRGARIMLNDRLVEHSWPLIGDLSPNQFGSEYYESLSTLKQMSIDIIASVPFFLGLRQESCIIPPSAGFSGIIWHLFIVASMPLTPDVLCAWIAERLETIGRTLGVHKAITLSRVLRKREETRSKETVRAAELESTIDQVVFEEAQMVNGLPDAKSNGEASNRLHQRALEYLNEMPVHSGGCA